MKLEIERPLGIIESAYFQDNGKAFSLLINTVERWVYPSAFHQDGDKVFEWWYYKSPRGDNMDIVRLIAETKREKEWLNRCQFESHEKEQSWIIFPPKSVTSFDGASKCIDGCVVVANKRTHQ